MISKKVGLKKLSSKGHSSTYSTRYFSESVPKHRIPDDGMPANAAYQIVHDELNVDANPALNLASFVTTWMEPEAEKLVAENVHKNFIDHAEYPQTEVIHERVVNMLARLFNAPEKCASIGTSTIGSSEAVLLALLAHKQAWVERRKAERKPFNRPNIVMGADVHVVWHKFARYFDVEPRIVPMTSKRFVLDAREALKLVDENTICVGAVLGTTFTGGVDPISELNKILLEIKKKKGWDIPIHVDAASGGFITPFIHPKLKWDFRLKQVKSINVSGHKYGLVYPGIGWLIFKDEKDLPESLIFHVNYLGNTMPTYTLNFSKGSSMIIAQYYNLIRLGKSGFKQMMSNILKNAKYLAGKLEASGKFQLLNKNMLIPVVAVKIKKKENFTVFDLSHKLRERGWIVPAYTLPPKAEETAVLRIVVRENFSRDMTEMLLKDLLEDYNTLETEFKTSESPTCHASRELKHRIC